MLISKDEFIAYSKKILELEILNENDNFLEIGLNSIQIIKYINTINTEYNKALTIVDLFENNTVELVYKRLNEN